MAGDNRPDTLDREYAPLRQEIVYWQTFRFTLLVASIALVIGVLGFVLKEPMEQKESVEHWKAFFASAFLLSFLAFAAGLSCYATRGNAKISAYLSIFHEKTLVDTDRNLGTTWGWEGRQSRFREEREKKARECCSAWVPGWLKWWVPGWLKRWVPGWLKRWLTFGWVRLSHWLMLGYLILGIASVLGPLWMVGWPRYLNEYVLLIVPGILFLIALMFLMERPRWSKYRDMWHNILEVEMEAIKAAPGSNSPASVEPQQPASEVQPPDTPLVKELPDAPPGSVPPTR